MGGLTEKDGGWPRFQIGNLIKLRVPQVSGCPQVSALLGGRRSTEGGVPSE